MFAKLATYFDEAYGIVSSPFMLPMTNIHLLILTWIQSLDSDVETLSFTKQR